MLTLNLLPVFSARGIEKPYAFLVRAGFTSHSANIMLNNPKAIKLHYIELLCTKLNCEPSDLFMWTPDKNHPLAENHALRNIGGTIDILLDLPYKQLKDISLKVKAQQKEAGQ